MDIKVVVVDDEMAVRLSLSSVLGALPGIKCVGAYASAPEALQGLARDQPHLVLLDLVMPGRTGLGCLRDMRARWPALKIILHTGAPDPDAVAATINAQGNGYLLKPVSMEEYQTALQTVMAGGFYISPSMARLMKDYQPMEAPEEILPRYLSGVLFQRWDKNKHVEGYWLRLANDAHYKVKELAGKLGITDRHLLRVWRESFRVCVGHWLRRRRLAWGRRWLLKNKSVKEAADQAGYKQTTNFHRQFNDCYHITPRHYARSQ